MSRFFKVSIVEKSGATVAALRRAKLALFRETDKVLTEFGNRLVRTAKFKYLSGPRPAHLGVKTNRLRSSIVARVQRLGKVTQLLFGTDVPYARIHEEGLLIRAHTRIITQAFGRQLKSPVAVSVRAFKMPKRPFLSPSVEDNKSWLRTNMLVAIRRAAEAAA